MARPKTGNPPKKNLNLTVDEKTKERLKEISKFYEKSISALVVEWAKEKEEEMERDKRVLSEWKAPLTSTPDITDRTFKPNDYDKSFRY